ncbi:MAG: hypothetical protein M3323_06160 [Actinomycetota bacterium]|nr:hypothetical protein [Actinomycetota bacterium]
MPIQKVEISVTTQSQPMQWGSLPAPVPPKITMNGNPIPDTPRPAAVSVGWRLAVIDATNDITKPGSYLFNDWIYLQYGQNWMGTYQYMYDNMFRHLYLAGNVNQQLVILASYGLDNNMPPTNSMLPVLLELGAGQTLQYWETHCNPGSEVANPDAYVSFPTNYILIGYSSWTYGQGYEKYDRAQGSMPVTSTLSATVSNIVPGP